MAGGSSLQKLRDNPAGEGSHHRWLVQVGFQSPGPSHATRSSGGGGAPMRGIFKATGPLVTSPAAVQGRRQMARGGQAAAGCFIRVGVVNPVAAHDRCAVRVHEHDRHLVPLTM